MSNFTFADINQVDGFIFDNDGRPDLKLTMKSLTVSALPDHYEGYVPLILVMNPDLPVMEL